MEKFRIVRKGYDTQEVDRYLEKSVKNYEAAMAEQKDRIFQLVEENKILNEKKREYEDSKDAIGKAIIEANVKAEQIVAEAQTRAEDQLEHLKLFSLKLDNYFGEDSEEEDYKKLRELVENVILKGRADESDLSKAEEISEKHMNFADKLVVLLRENVTQKQNYTALIEELAKDKEEYEKLKAEEAALVKELAVLKVKLEVRVKAKQEEEALQKEKAQTEKEESKKAVEETPKKHIDQEEVNHVSESLEDLCKELGLID